MFPQLPPNARSVALALLELVLLFGPVLLVIVLVRRWRPHGRGRCAACGYDLRGNVSGICPECGQRLEAPDPYQDS